MANWIFWDGFHASLTSDPVDGPPQKQKPPNLLLTTKNCLPKQFQAQELRERVHVRALNSPTTGGFGRCRMKNQAHFNVPKVSPSPPPKASSHRAIGMKKPHWRTVKPLRAVYASRRRTWNPWKARFLEKSLFGGKLVCWLHLGLRSRISHTHGGIVKAMRVRHCHTFLRGM